LTCLQASGSGPSKLNDFFSFSGDGDEVQGGEDKVVDLFADAAKAEAENVEEEEEGVNDDPEAEPEDDFNAAWEVLDLARALFEKLQDTEGDSKLKLADTYMALGDVSLETGQFF
jgi:HAT1-interacting factor 1